MYLRLFGDADDVLRGKSWVLARNRFTLRRLSLLIVVFGAMYGAVMGTFGLLTFGGIDEGRHWQVVYSATKVPMLLLATFSICLPSFFVANTLFGLRKDFSQSFRALMAAQAAIATVLASFAPLTAFWYASDSDYNRAIVFNVFVFAVSSVAGQLVLRRNYEKLIAENSRHRTLLYIWMATYAFVGIQFGWIMRPFIGSDHVAVQFLRPEAWDNAYVRVFSLIWATLF